MWRSGASKIWHFVTTKSVKVFGHYTDLLSRAAVVVVGSRAERGGGHWGSGGHFHQAELGTLGGCTEPGPSGLI